MTQRCGMCDKYFKDEEEIIAIVKVIYHDIPSRRIYATSKPIDIYELTCWECAEGDLIPIEDDEFDEEDDDEEDVDGPEEAID